MANVAASPGRRKDTRRIFLIFSAPAGMENRSRGVHYTATGLIAPDTLKQRIPRRNCARSIVLLWPMKIFVDGADTSARKSLTHSKAARCQFIWAKNELQSLCREKLSWMRETSAHVANC